MPSGRAYRIESPPAGARVTPALAAELGRVLDRFASEAGFTRERPLAIAFRPGIVGHHRVGRAADIYTVHGIGLDRWKHRWDEALECAARATDPEDHRLLVGRERNTNLGWRLYKALQLHGRWAQPPGYPVQLFGPWTRHEGPWRRISDRLLAAHRDHIHVAH